MLPFAPLGKVGADRGREHFLALPGAMLGRHPPARPATHCPARPTPRRGVTAPPLTPLTNGGESLGPHSVRPLRRLAGGRAPSDPTVFRPAAGAAGGGVLRPPNPVTVVAAAGRFPFVGTIRPTQSSPDPPNRELGRDRRGRQIPARRVPGPEPPEPCSSPENRRSRRFWPFGGRLREIRGCRIACNARTRPPKG